MRKIPRPLEDATGLTIQGPLSFRKAPKMKFTVFVEEKQANSRVCYKIGIELNHFNE